jgi:hypothetical protein
MSAIHLFLPYLGNLFLSFLNNMPSFATNFLLSPLEAEYRIFVLPGVKVEAGRFNSLLVQANTVFLLPVLRHPGGLLGLLERFGR